MECHKTINFLNCAHRSLEISMFIHHSFNIIYGAENSIMTRWRDWNELRSTKLRTRNTQLANLLLRVYFLRGEQVYALFRLYKFIRVSQMLMFPRLCYSRYTHLKFMINFLLKDSINFNDEALSHLIDKYCRESGVRNLQKKIQKIFRKSAVKGEKKQREVVSLDLVRLSN